MKLATRLIIIGTFVAWIAWDVIVAKYAGETESMVIRDWALKCTFFPFLIGFLCGHWFMPRRQLWASAWGFALPIWGLLIAWDVVFHFYPTHWQEIARFPLIWLVLGIPTGSYLWGQPYDRSIIP